MGRPSWGSVREALLFVGGFALAVNEALRSGSERPSLYVLFAAMMGLPFTRAADRKRRERRGVEDDERRRTLPLPPEWPWPPWGPR